MASLFVYDANVKKELKIDVGSASVADLYCAVAKFYDHLENPRKHLSLLFTDKELTFSKKSIISRCGIVNGSTIGAVLCLPDGYQATHGAVSDNGVAMTTGTTVETDTRELQFEATTAERDGVTSEREDKDKNGILGMRANDEGREESEGREEEKKKKKRKKKKRRKTKNQSELENGGMRKNSKEFSEEDENMNKTKVGYLIEEAEGRENEKDSQEKITKKKNKKKRSVVKTKEDHEKEEVKRPQLRSLPGIIEITDDEDFSELSPSARLPCDHLISSESMRGHCEAELAKGKVRIRCATCPLELDYRVVRSIACFTPGEMQSVETAILDLVLGSNRNVFRCPNCNAWTKAIDKDAKCLKCFCCSAKTGKRFLFCRNCFNEWENSSADRCTNLRCESYVESTLEILRKSPIIFPGNNPMAVLWSIYQHRVCPRCGLLTEFTGGCTQVHCVHCSYFYCFVCLRGAESKAGLECRPYFSVCSLAPLQTKIPLWKSE